MGDSLRLLLLLLCSTPLLAQAELTVADLSRFLDDLYRSGSSSSKMTMTVVTPDYQRTLSLESWTLGSDYSLVRILAPRKEMGIATLKRKRDMWNWLPKINKLVRVPPSMMMGSWMGSDLTNDDLMRDSSWERDFTAERVADQNGLVVVVYTTRPEATISWQKVITYFDAALKLPVKQEFYDEKGRLARRMTFDQVRVMDGKRIPSRILLEPVLEKGRHTEIIYDEMDFDLALEESFFSQNGLKKSQ